MEVRKLLKEGKRSMDFPHIESQKTKFKRTWRDDYLRVITAFANADGGD